MCTLWTRDSSALNADLIGNHILPSDSDQSAFFNNGYIHKMIFFNPFLEANGYLPFIRNI